MVPSRLIAVAALLCACVFGRAQAEPATVRLTGRLVDWQGWPIPDAAIAFAPRASRTTAELLVAPEARSGPDGRFVLAVSRSPAAGQTPPSSLLAAAAGRAAIALDIAWNLASVPAADGTQRREDTDVGELVMAEGVRLFGRVRDAAGRVLEGAEVVAYDLLDGNRVLAGPPTRAYCRALSGRNGTFELPATLPFAVRLECHVPGYQRRTLSPVAADSPPEVVLDSSGWFEGRVLHADGRPAAAALVTASYERHGPTSSARTGSDGGFRLPVDHAGRCRLRARVDGSGELHAEGLSCNSAIIDGPQSGVELLLPAPPAAADRRALRVLVLSAASGAPVVAARGVALWQPYAQQNVPFLELAAAQNLARCRPSSGNELELSGPAARDGRIGTVRVVAPGHAPATARDVQWHDEEEGGEQPVLVVRLHPEAVIAGRVVDSEVGTPVGGASVWVAPQAAAALFGPGAAPPCNLVRTADDGSFTVGELGEGSWVVRVSHPERPPSPSVAIVLQAGERREQLELKMSPGARVAGRILGIGVQSGSNIALHQLTLPSVIGAYNDRRGVAGKMVTAWADDGTFEFRGVALASFMLVVELASPPRCGGPLVLPIEPLRVRRHGVQRDFDASADAPGRIQGQVEFPAATPEGVALFVVAEPVRDDPNDQPAGSRFGAQIVGPRAPVRAGGSYSLVVAPGWHRLHLVEAASGIRLAVGQERVRVEAGGEVHLDLEAVLTEVVIALRPEVQAAPAALVDRIEVRHEAGLATREFVVVMGGTSDGWDTGVGVGVAPDQDEVRLWLPPGRVALYARNSSFQLQTGADRGGRDPVGREEFDLEVGGPPRREVVLRIGAPPLLPDDRADGGEDDGAGKR